VTDEAVNSRTGEGSAKLNKKKSGLSIDKRKSGVVGQNTSNGQSGGLVCSSKREKNSKPTPLTNCRTTDVGEGEGGSITYIHSGTEGWSRKKKVFWWGAS